MLLIYDMHTCKTIFYVKHDGRRKARIVGGGHMTEPPRENIYAGVIGADTVRLVFLVVAMQGLKVCSCDISTAFLH